MPRSLPTMSMPIMLRSAALAARVSEVDTLADADAAIRDRDATIDIQIQIEPAGDSPSAAAAPADWQAASSALHIPCLALTPRIVAAPRAAARVSSRAWLMPCVSRSSG